MPFQFSKEAIVKELEATFKAFQERLMRVHTGQVNPGLIEDIRLIYQGFEMRLKELGSIRLEGPRTLVIEPWDKESIGDIERALASPTIGLNPQIKGTSIYLNFPSITQEVRERLIKELKEMKEEERIKIRHVRDNWWEEIQNAQQQGDIREDEKFKLKDQLQKLVDTYNTKVDESEERKVKSLM